MKRFLIIILLIAGAFTLSAQSSIDDVLRRVEAASRDLEARHRLTEAQKTEARSENNLYNPEVEFEHMWGRGADRGGKMSELAVVQAFDFPTVYGKRSKIVRLKGELYDRESETFRRQVLLEAKTVCLDIIWLRQKEALLKEQMSNTQMLYNRHKQLLDIGESNIIEFNKIAIERLAVETDLQMTATALRTQLQQLAYLAGGEEVPFADTHYPPMGALPEFAVIESLYLEENPELRGLETEHEISRRTVALNRSLSLPRLEMGYRQNFGMEGKAIGFLAGISIPMFENRNKVKSAKAQQFFAQAQIESAQLNLSTQLRQLYEQALTLRRSADELGGLLGGLNNHELLRKALDAGQITVIEYYNEEAILFATHELLLEMERDYQLAVARLFSFEL